MRRRSSAHYAAIAGAAVFTVSAMHIPVVFLFFWSDQYSVRAIILGGLILCGLAGFGVAAILGLIIEIYRGLRSVFRLNEG
jgi:hypothetical protein